MKWTTEKIKELNKDIPCSWQIVFWDNERKQIEPHAPMEFHRLMNDNNFTPAIQTPYFGHSDYHGELCCEVNYNYFTKHFSRSIIPIQYGGPGWNLLIKLSSYLSRRGRMADCLDALSDYPVIDDELLSNREHELKVEFIKDNELEHLNQDNGLLYSDLWVTEHCSVWIDVEQFKKGATCRQ